MLGQTVAAYLYLDSRGTIACSALRPNASAFCVALGRMASLALANLKRIDMEKRSEQIRIRARRRRDGAEVDHARSARRSYGPFRCTGESRPGQYVGGDFFDIIPLSDDAARRRGGRRLGQGHRRVGADDRDAGIPARRAPGARRRRRAPSRDAEQLRQPAPPGEQVRHDVGRRVRPAARHAQLRRCRPQLRDADARRRDVRAARRGRRPADRRRRRRDSTSPRP